MFTFLIISASGSCQNKFLQVGPYHLNTPTKTIELPKKLKEISGLTYYDQFLYAVQDEKGNLYKINIETGDVQKFDFAKDGDFECVEAVGEAIFALTSKGALYKLLFQADTLDAQKMEKFIKKNRNLEGLTYEPAGNRLLIACKGSPQDSVKEILGYSLASNELESKPYFSVDQIILQKKLNKVSLLDYTFNPSAIAIHPTSGETYVLSHPVQQILVLDKNLQIKSLNKLNPKLFNQPEGICFDPIGNLYISNEGAKDLPGKIYQFKAQEN